MGKRLMVPSTLTSLLALFQLTGPGVSHELAIHRAATISDVRYGLELDVTARDSAVGRVDVRFHRTGADDAIGAYRRLLHDDRRRGQMAQAARQRVLKQHTYDHRGRQLPLRCSGRKRPADNERSNPKPDLVHHRI